MDQAEREAARRVRKAQAAEREAAQRNDEAMARVAPIGTEAWPKHPRPSFHQPSPSP